MKDPFILHSRPLAISLLTISRLDCDDLRQWKNANRFSFFFQELITPEQQELWFNQYELRQDDVMFMVVESKERIGCMGYRMIGSAADIYNVIRNPARSRGSGGMSRGLKLLCSYLRSLGIRNIRLKVLASNPAKNWYVQNGFQQCASYPDHVELKLAEDRFQPVDFEKS